MNITEKMALLGTKNKLNCIQKLKNNCFSEIINKICLKDPLQKKRLDAYLKGKDQIFFEEVEKFASDYVRYLLACNISLDYAVNAYLKMCRQMIKCQIYFMKTGKYPVDAAAQSAYENVYSNETEMASYMFGLALSQFLWPSHYEMFAFFRKHLQEFSKNVSSYLEIGPGHGLFLRQAVEILDKKTMFTAVDISLASIKMTKSILDFFEPEKSSEIKYDNTDMLDFKGNTKFDFITMGEVLEHVNFPEKLLIKLAGLLNMQGCSYISTCVNAPAIDHVYHFKSVDEIRSMIKKYGLDILDEKVLPVENISMEEIIKNKITINYCAIIRRK